MQNHSPIPIVDNPLDLLVDWYARAKETEPNDPNAFALATVDAQGHPDARIVLMKAYDDQGIIFYTNDQSRKGRALAAHPYATACFHWKSLQRQIRISGPVTKVAADVADAYFAGRPWQSRIASAASLQSSPMADRQDLIARMNALAEQYPQGAHVPRPEHWNGYHIRAERVEFWHEVEFRVHHRLEYTRGKDNTAAWDHRWLYP